MVEEREQDEMRRDGIGDRQVCGPLQSINGFISFPFRSLPPDLPTLLPCHPSTHMSQPPTTRSRTLLFISYRDSAARPRRRDRPRHSYAADSDALVFDADDEHERLIAGPSNQHAAIDVDLPPKWYVTPRFFPRTNQTGSSRPGIRFSPFGLRTTQGRRFRPSARPGRRSHHKECVHAMLSPARSVLLTPFCLFFFLSFSRKPRFPFFISLTGPLLRLCRARACTAPL